MEERKEAFTPEETATDQAGEEKEEQKNEDWLDDAKRVADRRRSYILWLLGGAYLVYTCYSLIRGYAAGEEDVSVVLLLIGIAFGGIGAALVVIAVRGMMKLQSLQKVQNDGQEKTEQSPPQEGEEEAPKKKPSIAERARLASTLGDTEEEETDV